MMGNELTFSDLAALALGHLIIQESLQDDEAQCKFLEGTPTAYTPAQVARALEVRGIPHQWFTESLNMYLSDQFKDEP